MIVTVGHSTRGIDEFIALLRAHGVEAIVDVRRFPGSRRHPQFNKEQLARALGRAGIAYEHAEQLGGRRAPSSSTENAGILNPQFRGYADHMRTRPFAEALDRLIARAQRETVSVMCAEADPEKCHRSLLADALAARGITAEHIIGPHHRREHQVSRKARVQDGSVTYPSTSDQQRLL